MSATGTKMTVEEFLELPDDGVERWLIDGEVRVFGEPGEDRMTIRNYIHCALTSNFAYFLIDWLRRQPKPRGRVLTGEAGIKFRSDSETSVGVDIAYVSAEVAAKQPKDKSIVVGIPVLAIEILSPSDKQQDIAEKVNTYLEAGVPHVWVVDPDLPSVRVYRPNGKIELVDASGVLTADPEMPGLKINVSEVFDF